MPSTVTAPDALIRNALVGLSLVPTIWFPKRTTFIPYYYLVFDTNNLFLEQDAAPVLNLPDFTPAQTQAYYQQMQNGTEFTATQPARGSSESKAFEVGGLGHVGHPRVRAA